MPKINVNAQEIYYEVHGKADAKPLVLIAGLGQDHTLWYPLLPSLEQTHRVVLFDNRGVGQSVVPSADYTTKDMATDLNALLESLHIAQADILGASMGGLIAQQLALNFPTKVDKLVLYSTFAKIRSRVFKLLLNTTRFFEHNLFEDALNSILYNSFSDNFLAQPELVQQQLAVMKNNPYPQTLEGFWGQFKASQTHDTRQELAKIKQQTLIIAGKRDILSMQEEAVELQTGIAGSALVTIPEVAHLAHLEQPSIFLQHLNEFLTKSS